MGANRRDKWCLPSQLQFVAHQVLLYEANPSIIHTVAHQNIPTYTWRVLF